MEVKMVRKRNTGRRWIWVLGYLGVLVLMLGCAAAGLGSSAVQQGTLQLDNGILKFRTQDGSLEQLAGISSFELIGRLDSTEPWKVAARPLQINEATQVAQNLQAGDMVRVRGTVLEDGTWLAHSIEPAAEPTGQSLNIIGEAASTDPLVVNGTTFDVTSDTVVTGDVQAGTLVRVDVLPLEDGTWEVIGVAPQHELPAASGCTTVSATVASVNGNEVQFVGWPAPVIVQGDPDTNNDTNENDDDGVDIAALRPGQQVLAVLCASENNQVVVTNIIALDDNDGNDVDGGEKVLICHKPDKKGGHTISVSSSAVPAHLGHGDKMGACP
jgi:hypothetical protein